MRRDPHGLAWATWDICNYAWQRNPQGADALTRVRHIAHRCGGSLAQCDLIHLTFTEAALRARKARLARALVAERAAQKPASLLNRLLQQRLRMIVPAIAGRAAARQPGWFRRMGNADVTAGRTEPRYAAHNLKPVDAKSVVFNVPKAGITSTQIKRLKSQP